VGLAHVALDGDGVVTGEGLIAAVVIGLVAGIAPGWRTWLRAIDDYRWHGRDNHLCNRVGCCR
jgi:hypothetical protein